MTHANNASGFSILKGVHLSKDVAKLNMLEATAARALDYLWSDTFLTNAGIDAGNSSGYSYRGSANFDVIRDATVSAQITQNTDNDTAVIYDGYKIGQSFTVGATAFRLETVILKNSKTGSPTGTIKAVCYAVDGSGYPTGAALAESNAADVSTFSGADVTYTFTTNPTLSAGTKYAIVLEKVTGGVWNASNCPNLRWQNTQPLAGGTAIRFISNWEDIAADCYIIINGSATKAVIQSVRALDLAAAVTSVIVFADITAGTGAGVVYVSTNDGSTWQAVTITDKTSGIVSVPSGQQVKLKVELTGNAELESWGVAA